MLLLHQPNQLFSFIVVDLLVLSIKILLWIFSLNPVFFSHPFLIRKNYRKSKTLKHNNNPIKKNAVLSHFGKKARLKNHFCLNIDIKIKKGSRFFLWKIGELHVFISCHALIKKRLYCLGFLDGYLCLKEENLLEINVWFKMAIWWFCIILLCYFC